MTRMRLLLILILPLCLHSAHAELVKGTDDVAQLPFWEWSNEYMTLRLVQRLPDQTRAYFSGRGFRPETVKTIADHCFFQTVYTNKTGADNKRVVQHDIRDWKYYFNGKVLRMRPREDWAPVWREKGVAQAQIVAFEWSLFPSRQIFEAGDYNWGMTVFDIPHGTKFDLEINWKVDGKPYTATMEGVTCAEDIYVAPQ